MQEEAPLKQPPVIWFNPCNTKSVPMGLAATFSVEANGTYPLTYQWMRTVSHSRGDVQLRIYHSRYNLADEGEVFSVTVTNSLGSATSSSVALHVTARAPQPGDLRFQQAGSPIDSKRLCFGKGTNLGALSSVGLIQDLVLRCPSDQGVHRMVLLIPRAANGCSKVTICTDRILTYLSPIRYFAYDGLDNQLSSLDDSRYCSRPVLRSTTLKAICGVLGENHLSRRL